MAEFANFQQQIEHTFAWAPAWLIAGGVFIAVVIAGLILQLIVLKLVQLVVRTWSPLSQFIFYQTRALSRFALLLFAIAVAFPIVPLPDKVHYFIQHALFAALIVMVGWIAYAGVDIAIVRYVNRLQLDAADNLQARKAATQMKILQRAANVMIVLITISLALMTFDTVREFGVSLFASAGVAGIVAGFAARPVLSNLIAGVQIALTQPIRIDDVVIVEGEWGRVEEISSTFVVIRIWDLRRLIVPLSYFLETPFQNWTYTSASILGYVYLYLDYSVDVEKIREQAIAFIKAAPQWDGQVANVQVSDNDAHTIQVRVLMSAPDSSSAWDMRCAIREALIAYVNREFPGALPRVRAALETHTVTKPDLPQS